MQVQKFGTDYKELHYVPDGSVEFYEANITHLKYKVQINDLRLPDYHRNNGVSKLLYKIKRNDQEYITPQMRVAEGQISLVDLIHRSYLHTINDKVWLVSAVGYMPL